MTRITKTRRKKMVWRAREQRQCESRENTGDAAQDDVPDDAEDESTQEVDDDAEISDDDGARDEADTADDHAASEGDGIPYILKLPNELLDIITTYAVDKMTPCTTLRLVNKRFRVCSQSQLLEVLQAKIWDLNSPHDIRSLNEISKVKALSEAIKSLQLTTCFELYHESEELFKYELAGSEAREQALYRLTFNPNEKLNSETDAIVETSSREMLRNMIAEAGVERLDREYRESMEEAERYQQGTGETPAIITNEMRSVSDALSRWKALRAEAQAMFGNIWTFSMTDHSLIGSHYDTVTVYVFAKERFITLLSETLGAFENLTCVAYLQSKVDSAKRYESLFERRRPKKSHRDSDRTAYKALMIGLDLLLRALQRAEIRPQSFAFPSPSLGFHRFVTSVSQETLFDVLKDTRTLRLSQVCERYLNLFNNWRDVRGEVYRAKMPDHHEEVDLTAKNFPNLCDLTIDLKLHMAPSDSMPLTPDNVVKLDRLTVRYTLNSGSASHLLHEPDCLSHFGPYLKHLVIANVHHGNWNQFFRQLGKIHLESLSIVVEPEFYNSVVSGVAGEKGLDCVQELFESAAKKCSIEPAWVRARVKRVWREQDDAMNRLLEDSEQEGPFDWEEDSDDDLEPAEPYGLDYDSDVLDDGNESLL